MSRTLAFIEVSNSKTLIRPAHSQVFESKFQLILANSARCMYSYHSKHLQVVTSSTPHLFINGSLHKYKALALRVVSSANFTHLVCQFWKQRRGRADHNHLALLWPKQQMADVVLESDIALCMHLRGTSGSPSHVARIRECSNIRDVLDG